MICLELSHDYDDRSPVHGVTETYNTLVLARPYTLGEVVFALAGRKSIPLLLHGVTVFICSASLCTLLLDDPLIRCHASKLSGVQ